VGTRLERNTCSPAQFEHHGAGGGVVGVAANTDGSTQGPIEPALLLRLRWVDASPRGDCGGSHHTASPMWANIYTPTRLMIC